nr:DUF418 domain-containing protein [Streptomonospora nanhaiensis]
MRTPLRPVMAGVFAPLGRMALTVYLTATLLVLCAARVLGLPLAEDARTALLAVGAILAVQWLFAVLWLRRFRQGPLEWVWRWASWARRPPLRVREPAAPDAAGPVRPRGGQWSRRRTGKTGNRSAIRSNSAGGARRHPGAAARVHAALERGEAAAHRGPLLSHVRGRLPRGPLRPQAVRRYGEGR